MQVSGRAYELLNDALVDAFNLNSLERMVQYGLGERLEVLVPQSNLNMTVFNLIEHYNRQSQVQMLVQAARRYNPTHSQLYQVAQLLERATSVSSHIGEESRSVGALELEKLVRRHIPMLDATNMRQQMMRVEGRMCLIEHKTLTGKGKAIGSGFLVGPDTVLTNYHVVYDYLAEGKAKHLQVRFDALMREDGVREPDEGIVFAVDEIPVAQPYTAADPSNVKQGPAPTELDFAILCLSEEAGNMQVGGVTGPRQTKARRGWLEIPQPAPMLEAGTPLIIYQYPGGRQLMMAIDTEAVIGTVWDGLRLRYRNNTEPGSSGSPVFNFNWQLVALHHAGEPVEGVATYNQGIPTAKIRQYLVDIEKTHLLGG